jgi:hypothetical protein
MQTFPESFSQFLSPDECAQIDQTLMPTRDRFSIRVTVYSWRYLQQVAQGLGIPVADLQPRQIGDWISQDATLQNLGTSDTSFVELLERLLVSSLSPLQKIAQHEKTAIETLTLTQIINWFEQQLKALL